MFDQTKRIMSVLRPILVFLKFTGFLLFPIASITTNESINYLEIWNIIKYVYYLFFATCGIRFKGIHGSDVITRLCTLTIYIQQAFGFNFVLLWGQFHSGKLLKLYRNLYNIDNKLNELCIVLDYRKLRKSVYLWLCFEITVSITLFLIYAYHQHITSNDNNLNYAERIAELCTYFILQVCQIVFSIQCFSLFIIIENMLHKLVAHLFETRLITANVIFIIGRLYGLIYNDVIRAGNKAISLQLLIVFGGNIVFMIFYSYLILTSIYVMSSSIISRQIYLIHWLWKCTIFLKLYIMINKIENSRKSVSFSQLKNLQYYI